LNLDYFVIKDLVMHKQAKTNDKNQHFGVFIPFHIVLFFFTTLTVASWRHRNVGFYC